MFSCPVRSVLCGWLCTKGTDSSKASPNKTGCKNAEFKVHKTGYMKVKWQGTCGIWVGGLYQGKADHHNSELTSEILSVQKQRRQRGDTSDDQ